MTRAAILLVPFLLAAVGGCSSDDRSPNQRAADRAQAQAMQRFDRLQKSVERDNARRTASGDWLSRNDLGRASRPGDQGQARTLDRGQTDYGGAWTGPSGSPPPKPSTPTPPPPPK
jgi:hypothetical protein